MKTYTPGGPAHHLLMGIRAMIAKEQTSACTWHSLHTWCRLNPCSEPIDLTDTLDGLAADGLISITATGPAGLSAGDYSNTRICLLGAGLLTISALNIRLGKQQAQAGNVAGRKTHISGVNNPLDRHPAIRAGADQASKVMSCAGGHQRPYDPGQGMSKAGSN